MTFLLAGNLLFLSEIEKPLEMMPPLDYLLIGNGKGPFYAITRYKNGLYISGDVKKHGTYPVRSKRTKRNNCRQN